ncbi:MAG: hypothetical protein ACYCOO_06030 [Chitinophagaceae bacterium]
MINLFKSSNPFIVVLLLIYALFLKLYFVFHPDPLVILASNGFVFNLIIHYLVTLFQFHPSGFALLAVGLIYFQALKLNKIINVQHLLPKPNFLPAMSYLLFSSFFYQWNVFSPVLLVNTLLLWIFSLMMKLYSKQEVKGGVFDISLLIGLAGILYFPALLFVLLLWMALLINRPFKLTEWVLAILGMLTPFYFLGTYLFFTGRWQLFYRIPMGGLSYPQMQQGYPAFLALIVILIFFIFGGWKLQQQFFKMLIQVRKIWLLLLAYVGISLVVSLVNRSFSINTWILCLVPLCAFFANTWWNINNKRLANLIHFTLIALVLVVEYFHFT